MVDHRVGERIIVLPIYHPVDTTKSDLLVINKIDLAPLVGANLSVMERDAKSVMVIYRSRLHATLKRKYQSKPGLTAIKTFRRIESGGDSDTSTEPVVES